MRSRLELKLSFCISSVCSGSARRPAQSVQMASGSGCPTNRTRSRIATSLGDEMAEREREGSAARSIQRTRIAPGGPVSSNSGASASREICEQPALLEAGKSISEKSRHLRAQLFVISWNNGTQDFAALHLRRLFLLLLQVWNETGTRFAPNRFSLRPPRTRNGSRSRIQEQIAIATATQRILAFISSVGFGVRGHVRVRHRTDSPWRALKAVSCHRTPNSSSTAVDSNIFFRFGNRRSASCGDLRWHQRHARQAWPLVIGVVFA